MPRFSLFFPRYLCPSLIHHGWEQPRISKYESIQLLIYLLASFCCAHLFASLLIHCPPMLLGEWMIQYPNTLWDKTRSYGDIKNSLSHEWGSERSERASGRVSTAEGASEASSPEQANEWAVRANGRASGPVLQSVFLAVIDHKAQNKSLNTHPIIRVTKPILLHQKSYLICLPKQLCSSLRRNAKEERVLFHYNGHGVPKPTVNGEIWVRRCRKQLVGAVMPLRRYSTLQHRRYSSLQCMSVINLIWQVFNKNFTQYIPLSVYDLQNWMGGPSIYVYDCNNAGIIVESFKAFAVQREQVGEEENNSGW